jgi:hypothetical protein
MFKALPANNKRSQHAWHLLVGQQVACSYISAADDAWPRLHHLFVSAAAKRTAASPDSKVK